MYNKFSRYQHEAATKESTKNEKMAVQARLHFGQLILVYRCDDTVMSCDGCERRGSLAGELLGRI
jgi:hypothetical protein